MATDIEVRVMGLLSAIEVPANVAEIIEGLGTEAVTVACEAALGSYPGIRMKVRTNAAAAVGRMTHPQARETLAMLVTDDNSAVAIRALRAVGRQRDDRLVATVGSVLRRATTDPLVADEAVRALQKVGSEAATRQLAEYDAAAPEQVPHRASALIRRTLGR
jgi:HEAT repeat protein